MKKIVAIMLTIVTASFASFTPVLAEELNIEENMIELEEIEQSEQTENSHKLLFCPFRYLEQMKEISNKEMLCP